MTDIAAMDQLRYSRINNFKNMITGKGKVDHIPHFDNYWSWKFYDAGYKFSEALLDYNKSYDAVEQFLSRYPMDTIMETGWRNPIQVTGILGADNGYIIDDEQYSISIKDQCFMDEGDYDALIANPRKYLWETFLPRKFTVLKGDKSSVDFRRFLDKYLEFGAAHAHVNELLHSYGIADFMDPNGAEEHWTFGFEMLFNMIRGIKGLSIDLRRRPDQVEAACEALNEVFEYPRLKQGYAQPDGSHPDYCVDMITLMLGHIILSPKQFERFYWPRLQRIAKIAEEKDKLVFLFAEGSTKRFWDFFRELPEGRFAIMTELDDIYELKKALPNMVVGGGMPTDLLGRGTPEACVEYTKKLIEELGGSDHRYFFAPSKMISFPNDCKRENLAAICQYLTETKF